MFMLSWKSPEATNTQRFANQPELESFRRRRKESASWCSCCVAFACSGSPFIAPPGTPRDRVTILQDAMTKAFKDPEFARGVQENGRSTMPRLFSRR
jgi:hypothetical protein